MAATDAVGIVLTADRLAGPALNLPGADHLHSIAVAAFFKDDLRVHTIHMALKAYSSVPV
jgi:hypothetical protein